jgi:glycosyltransferase involved in cell wall biosynthesis
MGKYSENIGPPKSMRELSSLLQINNKVLVSKNLRFNNNSSGFFTDAPQSLKFNKLRKKLFWLKNIPCLSLLVSCIYLITFNLKAVYVAIFHSDTLVIITQPFLVWPLSIKSNFVYIRRASVPLSEKIGIDPIKRFFERGFRRFPSRRTIYLTDFPEREMDSSVIPNFISISDPVSSLNDHKRQSPEFFFTGTFSYRKGADRVLELCAHMPENFPINIIGSLTSEFAHAEKKEKIIIHGLLRAPYEKYKPGDIFLSLSRLEGFQRSMVEAMLRGCIIIATGRPDSRAISESEGVFLVSNETNNEILVEHVWNIINNIKGITSVERIELGRMNKILAIERFSQESIERKWVDLICSLRC